MKAAVLYGLNDIRVEEIEKPKLENEGEVIIRVRACGICGTDLHLYKYGLFQNVGKPINSGWLMGHEFSGDVVEIAGKAEGFKLGDRVVAVSLGGQAEYVKISPRLRWSIIPMPAEIGYEEASTTEPLATALHAVNLALRSQKREHFELPSSPSDPTGQETIVIFGAGIIGLGILQILKAVTKAKVIMVDISARRLAMAQRLGADVIINAREEDPCKRIMDMTGAMELRYVSEPIGMVDTVFDCAGAPRELMGQAPLRQAITMVRPGGKIVIVAFFEKPLEIEITDIVAKNISLHGSIEWSKDEFSQAFELIRSGKIDRKALITHEFTLNNVKEAYEAQATTDKAVKVMLKP